MKHLMLFCIYLKKKNIHVRILRWINENLAFMLYRQLSFKLMTWINKSVNVLNIKAVALHIGFTVHIIIHIHFTFLIIKKMYKPVFTNLFQNDDKMNDTYLINFIQIIISEIINEV